MLRRVPSPAPGVDPVSELLKAARKRYLRKDGRRGLSQRRAAEAAGLGESTWYIAERPQGMRSEETATAIADLFGWPPDWIIRAEAGASLEELDALGAEAADKPPPTQMQRIEEKLDYVTEVLERVAEALRRQAR
jgi:hypothetical protein